MWADDFKGGGRLQSINRECNLGSMGKVRRLNVKTPWVEVLRCVMISELTSGLMVKVLWDLPTHSRS